MTFLVIIPVFNRWELTRRCLESLCRQDDQGFHVYLVDDGSTDGTADAAVLEFGSRLGLTVVAGSGDLWWGGGIRRGVGEALKSAGEGDYVVTVNNDVVVPPQFFAIARRIASAHPMAMLGGISMDSTMPDRVAKTGWRMISWPLAWTQRVWWPATPEQLAAQPEVVDIDFLPGTATATPVSIVRSIGTINADLLPHYHGDSEYSYRVKRSGYPVLLCRDLRVLHDIDATEAVGSRMVRPRLTDLVKSFFSKRSGNSLRHKWNFARACCPAWAIVPFMISDTVKVLVRSVGFYLAGERVEVLKKWTNRS